MIQNISDGIFILSSEFMPRGMVLFGAGCLGGQKLFYFKHGHVAYQNDRDVEQNRTQVKISSYGQTGDLGVRSKGQILLNFDYHVNSKILFQPLCAFLQKEDRNILNRIFILLLGSCPRGGTWGAGWVKNLSMGICDCAPSTAQSSLSFSFPIFFL